jgi:hypothetical protein
MAKTHPADQFGILARDGRAVSMPFPTGFVAKDGTATPLTSPLPYLTSTIALTVPDNAVRLTFTPTTALRVSDDPTVGRYYLVPANTETSFDVALMQTVYVLRDAISGTLYFQFATV